MAQLKAQLAKLMESDTEDESEPVSTANLQKVHFRSSRPGPTEVRQAMDAQTLALEQQASAAAAGSRPSFSVHLPMTGDPLASFRTEQHDGDMLDDVYDVPSVSSAQDIQIAGERAFRNARKSGISLKASDRVDDPQLWPHVALKGEFMSKNLSFHDLDLKSFVSGELEIIVSPNLSPDERSGRLHLLKELIYLSRGYSWEIIRNVYAAIVSKIEVRALSWSQWGTEFMHQIQFALIRQQLDKGSSRTKITNKPIKNTEQEGTFFCKDFNNSSCSKPDSHSGSHKGKRVTLSHICAKCWLTDRVRKFHAERDPSCPHSKSDS